MYRPRKGPWPSGQCAECLLRPLSFELTFCLVCITLIDYAHPSYHGYSVSVITLASLVPYHLVCVCQVGITNCRELTNRIGSGVWLCSQTFISNFASIRGCLRDEMVHCWAQSTQHQHLYAVEVVHRIATFEWSC